MKAFFGELIGTFILVFMGTASVALAISGEAFSGLFQIACVWGLAVFLGIVASAKLSDSHLNPAVSVAMLMAKNISKNAFGKYISGQLVGALIAGLGVYFFFGDSLALVELKKGILRGAEGSHYTAAAFGEFFPNPGFEGKIVAGHGTAFAAEFLGTFLLVLGIFGIVEKFPSDNLLAPMFIGSLVTLIICIIAPISQAGLNPARDLMPRLVAYFVGWGDAAFPPAKYMAVTVYVIAPIFGGMCAFWLKTFFSKLISDSE